MKRTTIDYLNDMVENCNKATRFLGNADPYHLLEIIGLKKPLTLQSNKHSICNGPNPTWIEFVLAFIFFERSHQ